MFKHKTFFSDSLATPEKITVRYHRDDLPLSHEPRAEPTGRSRRAPFEQMLVKLAQGFSTASRIERTQLERRMEGAMPL